MHFLSDIFIECLNIIGGIVETEVSSIYHGKEHPASFFMPQCGEVLFQSGVLACLGFVAALINFCLPPISNIYSSWLLSPCCQSEA